MKIDFPVGKTKLFGKQLPKMSEKRNFTTEKRKICRKTYFLHMKKA